MNHNETIGARSLTLQFKRNKSLLIKSWSKGTRNSQEDSKKKNTKKKLIPQEDSKNIQQQQQQKNGKATKMAGT